MSQGSVVMPTSGIVSGVTMATDINNAFDAIRTMYLGAAAPSADTPEEGQLWLDSGTSTAYKILKIYDGAQWLARAYLDDVNHIYIPPTAGGSLTVSSTAPNLGGAAEPASAVSISGTTTITTFGTNAINGQIFFVTFQGVLTLTYNATSFILPGRANIVTAAADMSIWQYLGSGNWQCLVYQPVATLVGSVGTVTGAFITNNVISPTQITANQNDYAPTGNANAVVFELSSDGLADYLITGIANGTSGRQIVVRNTNAAGGGRFYFPNQSTSSLAANRFKMAGIVQLNPQQQVEFIYDNSQTAWVPLNVVLAQPIAGQFRNLQCGTASGRNFSAPASPLQQFKVTADALTLTDTDGNTVSLQNVSVTADITSTGVNGLDTYANAGRSTGIWYSGWVIYNPITNMTAGLLSTSTGAGPTVLPSGYTFRSRVGWATTNYSTTKNFLSAVQNGREAKYVIGTTLSVLPQYPVMSTAVSGSDQDPLLMGATVGVGPFIPPTAVAVDFSLQWFNASATSPTNAYVLPSTGPWSPNASSNPSTGAHQKPQFWISAPADTLPPILFGRIMLESSNIYLVASGGIIPQTLLQALGWQDNL